LLALSATLPGCVDAPADAPADASADGAAESDDEGAVSAVSQAARAAGRLLRPDVNQGLCIDAAGGVEFVRPYMRVCDSNNPNLRWTLTNRTNGFLQPDVNPGLCVDAAGGVAGVQVYMRACDGNNGNLKWTFRPDGQLSPQVNPGLCLDAAGGVPNVLPYLRPCDAGNPNLRWSFNTKWQFTINQCAVTTPSGSLAVNSFPRCMLGEGGVATGTSCGSSFPPKIFFGMFGCTGE
jgi:Ricin-type beta-trefoil lectin domain